MAKWSCKCGYPMNDRNVPNENGYVVYSEFDWDEAGNLTVVFFTSQNLIQRTLKKYLLSQ